MSLNSKDIAKTGLKCTFVSSLGNQCTNLRQTDSSVASQLCSEHHRIDQINRMKMIIGKKKQLETSETIVSNLGLYVQVDKIKPQSTTIDDDEEEISVTNADPFFDINATERNNEGRKILEYASDSEDSDSDTPLTLSNTWINEIDNSDDESIDSEGEDDLLKHAGIYQIEEIVKISKEKTQKLQSLYVDQFQRLQKVLKDKRRTYLQSLKREKEHYSSIHDQYRDSPKERKLYAKLKAMNHYHQRKYGVEAILYRKYIEKRQLTEQTTNNHVIQSKNVAKCNFSDGVKCMERTLPGNTKYCRKHIMEDKKQILFKLCGIEKSGVVCQEPIMNVFEDSSCVLHTPLFSMPRTYVKRKYESETEEEDIIDRKDIKIEVDDQQDESAVKAVDSVEDITIN